MTPDNSLLRFLDFPNFGSIIKDEPPLCNPFCDIVV